MKRAELLAVGMFPVLTGKYSMNEDACVPLAMVLPHEQQAKRNHDQSIQRLAERGGLCPSELVAVLRDRDWHSMPDHEAWQAIFDAYAQFKSADGQAEAEGKT